MKTSQTIDFPVICYSCYGHQGMRRGDFTGSQHLLTQCHFQHSPRLVRRSQIPRPRTSETQDRLGKGDNAKKIPWSEVCTVQLMMFKSSDEHSTRHTHRSRVPVPLRQKIVWARKIMLKKCPGLRCPSDCGKFSLVMKLSTGHCHCLLSWKPLLVRGCWKLMIL